jgi:putative N-acetyltransferase (TIGR04045 family)
MASVECAVVGDAAGRAAHHAVRRAVFVVEQGVFPAERGVFPGAGDTDARDADPATLHVLGRVDGRPAGAVRLYPLGGGLWQGDRLAVLPVHRRGLGASLVRRAVALAAERGGDRMVAHVQPPNEVFFRRLGWTRRGGPADYLGRPHLLMDVPLAAPPATGALLRSAS